MIDLIRNAQSDITHIRFEVKQKELLIIITIDQKNITYKLNLSEFHNSKQWYDCSSHIVHLSTDTINSNYEFVNRDAITYSSKGNAQYFSNVYNPFVFWMDNVYKDSNFLEMKYTVYISENCYFSSNVSVIENKEGLSKYWLPTLMINGPDFIKVNETVELTLISSHENKLTNKPIIYYLEALSGYINKKKIIVENGKATFKVKASELDPGEIMEIKAGYKFRSSVVQKIITVIK